MTGSIDRFRRAGEGRLAPRGRRRTVRSGISFTRATRTSTRAPGDQLSRPSASVMSLVAHTRRHLARWATRAAARPMAIIPESHQVKERKDADRVDFWGESQDIDSRCAPPPVSVSAASAPNHARTDPATTRDCRVSRGRRLHRASTTTGAPSRDESLGRDVLAPD